MPQPRKIRFSDGILLADVNGDRIADFGVAIGSSSLLAAFFHSMKAFNTPQIVCIRPGRKWETIHR
jgi:hypothetical protein